MKIARQKLYATERPHIYENEYSQNVDRNQYISKTASICIVDVFAKDRILFLHDRFFSQTIDYFPKRSIYFSGQDQILSIGIVYSHGRLILAPIGYCRANIVYESCILNKIWFSTGRTNYEDDLSRFEYFGNPIDFLWTSYFNSFFIYCPSKWVIYSFLWPVFSIKNDTLYLFRLYLGLKLHFHTVILCSDCKV